jgi:hypothetical protein
MLILPRRFKSQPQNAVPLDLASPVLSGVSNAIILYGDSQAWLRNRAADSQLGSLIPNPTVTGGGITDYTDIGPALEFDGTSTYLDFGTANIPTTEFTLLWGGVFDANDSPRGWIDCTNNGVSGWNIYQGGGDTMYFNNSSYPAGNPSTGWTPGQFFHGALRNKGGVSADWFRNGVKVASGSGVSPAAPTLPLWIGRLKVGGLPYIKGRFSYLYLVDKFLDDDTLSRIPANPFLVIQQRRIFPEASASAGAYTLTASPGSFSVTGTAAGLKFGRVLAASSGSVLVSGTAATLKKGYSLQAASGSVSISGTAASLKLGRVLQASSASFAVTGTAATLTLSSNKALQAASGTFVVTGSSATLKVSRVLPASAGSAQVNGTASSLKYARLLSAAPGSFAISGTDATLTYQQVGNRTLAADAGSFAVSGTAASLRLNRKVSVASGSFAFAGTAATLRYARTVIAEAGAFAISGTDAILTYSGVPAEITSTVERTAIFRAIVARNATFQRSKSVSVKFN